MLLNFCMSIVLSRAGLGRAAKMCGGNEMRKGKGAGGTDRERDKKECKEREWDGRGGKEKHAVYAC